MSPINASTDSDEIDWQELLRVVWAGRALVVATAALVTVLSLAYALLATEIYRAESVVQIREEGKNAGGLSSLLGQFGGLTDVAGLSLSGNNRPVALATLKSRLVIEEFIVANDLLPILFKKSWDPDKKAWRSLNPKKQPTPQRGYELFSKSILKVSEDRKSGLVTVAVEWRDPAQAQQWISDLLARTNRKLKARSIDESERNLQYLQKQVKETPIVELQKAIYSLMEIELKKLMLARNGEDYALRMIDPPQLPERRIWPKRAQVVLTGGAAGLLLGCVIVFLRRPRTPVLG